MSLLFRRRTETRALSYRDVWGTGGDVDLLRGESQDTAMRLVAVYAATRLLADLVASSPLQVYRETPTGQAKVPPPPLFRAPSQHGGCYDWVSRAMTSLTLRGNAYGLVTASGANGWPDQVEWLHPDRVTIGEDDTSVPARWVIDGRHTTGEIIHIPALVMPGRVLGWSPLKAIQLATETGIRASEFGRDYFRNGSVPAGVLQSPTVLTQAQTTEAKAKFKAAASGRDLVAFPKDWSYESITIPAEESQFLATISATATQIAAIYGIPPEMIGGESGGPLHYSSPEQNMLSLVTLTLRPWLKRLETVLTDRMLPRPMYVKFNADSLVRTDLLTRYRAHEIALSNGYMTPNEIRALEDMPPLPGGDTPQDPRPSSPSPPPSGGTES